MERNGDRVVAFQMATSGSGWRLAGSLIQLGHEIEALSPNFTCLGTLGNAAHQAEGDASDHNPFVKDPHTGVGIVRAIDIGGPDAQLKSLRQLIWARYAASDPRIYSAGYAKGCSDNLINNEGLPFGVHEDDGDAGHLHISVTRTGTAGYVPAIDSASPWNLGVTVAQALGSGTPIGGSSVDETSIANKIVTWNIPADGGQQPLFWVLSNTYTLGEQNRDAIAAARTEIAALKAAQTPTVDVVALAGEILKQLKAA